MPDGDEEDERKLEEDPRYVARGRAWDVAMTPSVHKRFRKFPRGVSAALEKLMELMTFNGPEPMQTTQINSEGRHPRGDGKTVLIRAFKDGPYRVYGGKVTVNRKPTFICTAVDENKKRRCADQATLARAAKGLRKYFEQFGSDDDE
jgi:hypothetical protein